MPDLELRNISLILRWWWKPYADPNSMWSICISNLRAINLRQLGLLIWMKKGSFFWNQLLGLKEIFDWATEWFAGHGYTISYWFHDWGQGILANMGLQIQFRRISLGAAAESRSLPTQGVTLSEEDDVLRWRWTETGIYTANSAYTIMISAGKIGWRHVNIWKFAIPPTVKLFLFLLIKGKVLTRDVMTRRKFRCEEECAMCDLQLVETALHLFVQCTYAQAIWRRLGISINNRCQTIEEAWTEVSMREPILSSCAIWAIWKN